VLLPLLISTAAAHEDRVDLDELTFRLDKRADRLGDTLVLMTRTTEERDLLASRTRNDLRWVQANDADLARLDRALDCVVVAERVSERAWHVEEFGECGTFQNRRAPAWYLRGPGAEWSPTGLIAVEGGLAGFRAYGAAVGHRVGLTVGTPLGATASALVEGHQSPGLVEYATVGLAGVDAGVVGSLRRHTLTATAGVVWFDYTWNKVDGPESGSEAGPAVYARLAWLRYGNTAEFPVRVGHGPAVKLWYERGVLDGISMQWQFVVGLSPDRG